jgi:glycosyltransferase involved in cell wall biosynthesis
MRILMLGWEYPPHIAGGLGTACEGLTKGLSKLGLDITFVVPKLFGDESAGHMNIVEPIRSTTANSTQTNSKKLSEFYAKTGVVPVTQPKGATLIKKIAVSAFLKPYWTEEDFSAERAKHLVSDAVSGGLKYLESLSDSDLQHASTEHYSGNIFDEVKRFTARVVNRLSDIDCDLIHAHDWMTLPAGVALSQVMGKPLVIHVHSLEYDRSGANPNPEILAIERLGLDNAQAVIAVSHYTKQIIQKIHQTPEQKIHVVHNGIYPKKVTRQPSSPNSKQTKRLVLFLGRVTFQKGPEYFVKAAAKVIEQVRDVTFVMAGAGDMLKPMVDLAKALEIEKNFLFPGFLNEKEVEEMFMLADLYVMPSVSEPFGISALEAINFETPALISRQSGVSEVMANTLKFDFWDVDRLADLIINALIHPELRNEMTRLAKRELQTLQWDASAMRTVNIYQQFQ